MGDEKIGPTGRYPDGSIAKEDKGEIRIVVGAVKGRVIIHFGTDIQWLGLTPDGATQLANKLIEHANFLSRNPY
jgi:hypothetical protein